jgi:L-aminopeptidase/D-esterase-like protein
VPIVPAAILFDLGLGDPAIRPTAECGYAASSTAHDGPVEEGSIGAGAGATVGKLQGLARAMKGGIGSAAIVLPDGLVVAALVAVNARGDVIDPETGQVVAGTRGDDGVTFSDARRLLREGAHGARRPGENTTLGVVATNARLTKTQATKVAQMAHDGFARAVAPAHTPLDGDTIFALATGRTYRRRRPAARRRARGRRDRPGDRARRRVLPRAPPACRRYATCRADDVPAGCSPPRPR